MHIISSRWFVGLALLSIIASGEGMADRTKVIVGLDRMAHQKPSDVLRSLFTLLKPADSKCRSSITEVYGENNISQWTRFYVVYNGEKKCFDSEALRLFESGKFSIQRGSNHFADEHKDGRVQFGVRIEDFKTVIEFIEAINEATTAIFSPTGGCGSQIADIMVGDVNFDAVLTVEFIGGHDCVRGRIQKINQRTPLELIH